MSPMQLLLCSVVVFVFSYIPARSVKDSEDFHNPIGCATLLSLVVSFVCIPVSLVWMIISGRTEWR